MGKTKPITLEDAKRLDERIAKEYPDHKPVKLADMMVLTVKEKKKKSANPKRKAITPPLNNLQVNNQKDG